MDKTELKTEATRQWSEIRLAYAATKTLLIHSEEKLRGMKLYPAPLLEHRDALDHIMSYSKIIADSGLCEAAISELSNAKQHEIRAFYDVADYICITIRKDISETLDTLSQKQIVRIWPEYKEVRAKVIQVSDQIANIRNGTRETVAAIPGYEDVVQQMFDIYATFQTDIQPKIGHGFYYRLRKFFND